jgi:hypothetical protein
MKNKKLKRYYSVAACRKDSGIQDLVTFEEFTKDGALKKFFKLVLKDQVAHVKVFDEGIVINESDDEKSLRKESFKKGLDYLNGFKMKWVKGSVDRSNQESRDDWLLRRKKLIKEGFYDNSFSGVTRVKTRLNLHLNKT